MHTSFCVCVCVCGRGVGMFVGTTLFISLLNFLLRCVMMSSQQQFVSPSPLLFPVSRISPTFRACTCARISLQRRCPEYPFTLTCKGYSYIFQPRDVVCMCYIEAGACSAAALPPPSISSTSAETRWHVKSSWHLIDSDVSVRTRLTTNRQIVLFTPKCRHYYYINTASSRKKILSSVFIIYHQSHRRPPIRD